VDIVLVEVDIVLVEVDTVLVEENCLKGDIENWEEDMG